MFDTVEDCIDALKRGEIILVTDHADRENELMADLKSRTGLDIRRVEVGHIDYLKDIAYVKIYYASDKPANTINHLTKIKRDSYF